MMLLENEKQSLRAAIRTKKGVEKLLGLLCERVVISNVNTS